MPTKTLPASPSLAHLKSQTRDLIRLRDTGDLVACQRIREFHPRFADLTDAEIARVRFSLADAQLTIAREYGFGSWPRLKAEVDLRVRSKLQLPIRERIEDPVFGSAVDLIDAGNDDGLRDYLRSHSELAKQRILLEGGNYFRNPSLLEFCAENPVRNGRLPTNITSIARVILDAGTDQLAVNDTLGLVCSGRVARECDLQKPLIDVLCEYGADPSSAMLVATAHGELQAVSALIAKGAKLTLATAAALGRTEDLVRMLPKAGPKVRHLALAFATQFGQVGSLMLLLNAGEDPNRYNPKGAHSHSTPLHQAAFGGHLEAVKMLLEAGANAEMKDVLYGGTPVEWAEHGGRKEVADFLRAAIQRN